MANIPAMDDDEKIRDLLYMMLRRKGPYVLTADYGQRSCDAFRRERPHGMVLHFKMPDMDGLPVLMETLAINSLAPVVRLMGAGTAERKQ